MKKIIFIAPALSILTSALSYSMECRQDTYVIAGLKNQIKNKQQLDLHNTVWLGDCNAVKDLLDKQANVNQKDSYGYSPLHVAAYQGDINMIRLLLRYGANHTANHRHDSPYDIAIKKGHGRAAALLAEHWVSYMSELL